MVYERYVKKNGNLHGPYYYESYRDEHGNVQKRYLGSDYSYWGDIKRLRFFLFVICCMIVLLLFVLFFHNSLIIKETASKIGKTIGKSFTGFVIDNRQRSIQETQISACGNLSSANTIYQLTANAVSNDTCFKIIADNVTLDCQGYFINYSVDVGEGIGINISNINAVVKRCSIYAGSNNPFSHGISLGVSGANISDVFIKAYGSNSYGVYFNYAHYSNLTNVSIETTGTSGHGLYYNFAENNSFRNGKINVADSVSNGAYIMSVNGESIINSNITMSGGGIAIYVFSSSSNTFSGNSISSVEGPPGSDAIVLIGNSDYNVIDNNTIYSAGGDGIDVSGSGVSYPTLNNISRNTFYSGSITAYDIYISSDDSSGGTWLIDQVGKTNDYYFSSANAVIMESSFGRVNWFMSLIETGGNLSQNITITNNSVVVKSVNMLGLNQSANVTFFNFGDRGYTDPGILKDGAVCSACYNFTSLTANNVIFNVTGWSNYTIGGGLAPGELNECGNLTSANIAYTLVNDVSSTGTCFTIGGENINFNCAGRKILYGTNGLSYAFDNYYKYKNFSVINCIIEQVNGSQSSSHAIYMYYSGNNTIYNNTIVVNGSGSRGIWLDTTSNVNISSNRINTTTGEGVYLGPGSSNVIKDNLFFVGDGYGVSLFGDSDYNIINNNTIKSNWSSVYIVSGGIPTAYPNLNNISGNSFKRNTAEQYDVYISGDCSSGAYDGTWLIDQIRNINSYYLSSSCPVIKDNSYGMIKWFNSLGASSFTGVNLSSEIIITNNSAIVNGSNINLNGASNVTFFNIGNRDYSNIAILKNGVNCLDCYNFTSLTTNNVIFNVTGWSNYTIGEGLAPGQVNLCQNLTSANITYTLVSDVSSNATCFIVGGENINFNCAGKKILYSMNSSISYAFDNYYKYKNFSVMNCIIEQVNGSQSSSHAIYMYYSGNNTIYNNTIVVNGSGSRGIWLDTTSNVNISSNRINTTTGEGVYLGPGSSNVIKDNLFFAGDGNAISLFGDSDYNIIKNNIIKSNWSEIYLINGPGGYPNLNNVSGNTFKGNVGNAHYNIYMSSDCNSTEPGGTWLVDQISNINDYRIYDSCFVVQDSAHGMVKWFSSISPISALLGVNLSSEIIITNNSIIVNGSNTYLTGMANVTLFNIGNRNYSDIGVLRDGINCLNCYNFTSLTANTVVFSVPGFSNYTIGEWDASPPRVTIHVPRNITYLGKNINFSVELNENGSVEFNLDNQNWNYSMDNPGSNNRNFSYLYLALSNGAHTLKIYANDSFNNKNQTENVTFRVSVDEGSSSGSTGGIGSLIAPGVLPGMPICVPQFLCLPTGACINGFRAKECVDVACGGSSYASVETCNVELCVPEWECSNWDTCENGRSKRECKDVNNCMGLIEKPNSEVECLPKKQADKEEVVKIECTPEFVCGEWNSCVYSDSIEDVLKGEIGLLGEQERVCYDSKGCVESYTESKSCVSEKAIEVKREEVDVGGGRTESHVVARSPETKKTLVQIALDSWKKKGVLDIKFVQ